MKRHMRRPIHQRFWSLNDVYRFDIPRAFHRVNGDRGRRKCSVTPARSPHVAIAEVADEDQPVFEIECKSVRVSRRLSLPRIVRRGFSPPEACLRETEIWVSL